MPNVLDIYLAPHQRIVSVRGETRGIAYGDYSLDLKPTPGKDPPPNLYNEIIKELVELERGQYDPSSDNFRSWLKTTGQTLYGEIFESKNDLKGGVRNLLKSFIDNNYDDPSKVRINFLVDDPKYLILPLEFIPVYDHALAAKFPVFTSVIKQEKLSIPREEFYVSTQRNERLNIFLVCSDTTIKEKEEFLVGDQNIESKFGLESIPEIDDERKGEIYELKGLIKRPEYDGKVNVFEYPTGKIDYETFRGLLRSNTFDIIHYNGHGIYCADIPPYNFIFFWKFKKGSENGKKNSIK